MSNETDQSTVFIVDDEAAVADSIALLLRSVGIRSTVHNGATAFLEAYDPDSPGCLLLDVRMPRMSGLELQKELNRRRCFLPIIFITGHGDVPMAVEAMRAGAVDFLQKPFNDDELIRRVQRALDQDRETRARLAQREALLQRYELLTPRERDITWRLVDGQANKAAALELDISERTVEQHRAQVMRKMDARSLAQLVQMMLVVREALPAAE